jgi:hypothetical protein
MTDVAAFGTRSEIDEAYADRGDFVLDLERARTLDRRARTVHRGTGL